MGLSDLPQFTVTAVQPQTPDGNTRVVGQLSHLRGVHNDGGYLYRSIGPSIVGGFDAVPRQANMPLVFITPDAHLAPELAPGTIYPWLDMYWQPYHLEMILAGPQHWQRRTFTAAPAHFFRQAGVTGWQPVGGPLPEGAVDLGVRERAWDHEHCELCRATVGANGVPEGYVNAQDHWLCQSCFERYAARRDVSFATEV
jgi:hypothetical protein